MGDTANMPPLSGEIMAGDAHRDAQTQNVAGADVVDAEFVTIPRSPAASAFTAPDISIVRPVQPPAGMEVLTARAAQGGGSRRAGIGFWTTGCVAAAAAFWMSGGHTLSRHLPLMRGEAETVRIAGLTSRVADTATGPRLFIDGEVRNTAVDGVVSPDLMINVTAQDGLVTRYRLTTGAGRMASGESRRFSSRLDAPDAGVRSVTVTLDKEGLN